MLLPFSRRISPVWAKKFEAVERAGVRIIHVDVMDGHFVPNISIGVPVVASLRKATRLLLDVHLMIENPEQYVEPFAKAGADTLLIHQEATRHLDRAMTIVREHGCRAGVVINPATPVAALEDILYKVDQVLVMSVNPGFGGQEFLPHSLEKIRQLHRFSVHVTDTPTALKWMAAFHRKMPPISSGPARKSLWRAQLFFTLPIQPKPYRNCNTSPPMPWRRKFEVLELRVARILGIAAMVGSLFLGGCLGKKKTTTAGTQAGPAANDSVAPDKVLYERSEQDLSKGHYEVARLSLQALINTYPDSEYLAKAKVGHRGFLLQRGRHFRA